MPTLLTNRPQGTFRLKAESEGPPKTKGQDHLKEINIPERSIVSEADS